MTRPKVADIFRAIAAATVVVLSACASSPSVSVQAAPRVDLTAYESFGFFEPLGTDRAGYRSIISETLRLATIRELEARGLRHDEVTPELRVNFNARLETRWRAVPGSVFVQDDFFGYRGFGGTRYLVQPTEFREYPEGTLLVDLVDATESRLVWEGVVVGRPVAGDQAELRQALDAALARLFADFPGPVSGAPGA